MATNTMSAYTNWAKLGQQNKQTGWSNGFYYPETYGGWSDYNTGNYPWQGVTRLPSGSGSANPMGMVGPSLDWGTIGKMPWGSDNPYIKQVQQLGQGATGNPKLARQMANLYYQALQWQKDNSLKGLAASAFNATAAPYGYNNPYGNPYGGYGTATGYPYAGLPINTPLPLIETIDKEGNIYEDSPAVRDAVQRAMYQSMLGLDPRILYGRQNAAIQSGQAARQAIQQAMGRSGDLSGYSYGVGSGAEMAVANQLASIYPAFIEENQKYINELIGMIRGTRKGAVPPTPATQSDTGQILAGLGSLIGGIGAAGSAFKSTPPQQEPWPIYGPGN